MHDTGIVWVDAKPDNVLTDQNNDAWIIDFGGGYTDGWASKDFGANNGRRSTGAWEDKGGYRYIKIIDSCVRKFSVLDFRIVRSNHDCGSPERLPAALFIQLRKDNTLLHGEAEPHASCRPP